MSNRFLKIFLVFMLVLVGLFLIYPTVNAALVPCGRSTGTPEEMKPCTTCDLFALASRIINFVLFTVVPAVAVLFYLIGGLMILLGGARPGLISTGKNFFWNTTIGLFIIFGAWMITNTVLKSIAGNNDISNHWYSIQCTNPTQPKPPPTQTYVCSSENRCVAASSGTVGKYTTSNCNNECQKTGGALSITTVNLPDATVGQQYNHFITVSGGTVPYTFYYTGNLPDGLDLYDESGAVSGVPTTAGQFTFIVEVNDSSVPLQNTTGTIKITIKPAGANLSITTSSLPDGIANQNYSQTLQATGGKTPYAWSKTAGNLPTGLTLSTGGVIAGTPTTAGTYTLTVKVEDSTTPTKQSVTKELNIKVNTAVATTCLFSGVNLCQGQPLKLSGGKLVPSTTPACGISRCSQYVPAINDAASRTGISANLLKATMFKESACLSSATNTTIAGGESYGLMQMQVGTANAFRNYCGVTETITSSWLTNPTNADKSICMAAYFYKSLADGACGYSPRNILAGYSAGPGRCQASADCTVEKSCDGSTVRQWECLYDNPQHTVCNGDNTIIGASSKLNETKYSVVNKLYCVDHPGF